MTCSTFAAVPASHPCLILPPSPPKPTQICNLSALRELDLSGNPLAKLSARLPPGLTRLALRSCRLSEAPAAALLRPLSATLEDLDLTGNDFGPRMKAPRHEKTVLAPLGCLTRLTCLALADCRLLALPAELTALGPSLRALDCSDNHDLGGVNNLLRRDNPPLAPLWALTRLRELSMAYCYLWRLPPELVAAAGTLERLNLTGCSDLGDRGTDVGIQLGPAGLGTLVALRHLTLRYCDLRAEVAPSLLQLPDLKVRCGRRARWLAGRTAPPQYAAATAGRSGAWASAGIMRGMHTSPKPLFCCRCWTWLARILGTAGRRRWGRSACRQGWW